MHMKICQCAVNVLLLTKEDKEEALWVDRLHTSHDTHRLLTSQQQPLSEPEACKLMSARARTLPKSIFVLFSITDPLFPPLFPPQKYLLVLGSGAIKVSFPLNIGILCYKVGLWLKSRHFAAAIGHFGLACIRVHKAMGWACTQRVEPLPSSYEALGLINPV